MKLFEIEVKRFDIIVKQLSSLYQKEGPLDLMFM